MKKLLFFLLIILTVTAYSQDRSKFLYAEFGDQSVTFYPFYKPFGSNFDPAITLGAGIDYRRKENRTLFQTFQLTGYNMFFTGNGITLSSSLGYRYSHATHIFGEASAGLGAFAFFSTQQTYVFNQEEGSYMPAKPLHVFASVPANFVLGYKAGNVSFYLKYRYMILGPTSNLLTVIPISVVCAGIRYNI